MDSVASRINRLRKHLGLTQEALGRAAGVSKAAVSQWERGLTEPERDALLSLQRTTKINPEWVANGRGEMIAKWPNQGPSADLVEEGGGAYLAAAEADTDPQIRELLDIFGKLSADDRARVILMAGALIPRRSRKIRLPNPVEEAQGAGDGRVYPPKTSKTHADK